MEREETKGYIESLFMVAGIKIKTEREAAFNALIDDPSVVEYIEQINHFKKKIMNKWKVKNRVFEIQSQHIVIPNGTVGKIYIAKLDIKKNHLEDLTSIQFEGLSEIGLEYNNETNTIEGVPTKDGDIKIKLLFNLDTDSENNDLYEKWISIIINPDPKKLWQVKQPPDDTPYKKDNDAFAFNPLGEKHIVAASKRGRSHQNEGSFRDDDFAYKYYDKTGWSIVAVADGAGSYPLSREGSRIACKSVVEYFENEDYLYEFDVNMNEYFTSNNNILDETETLSKKVLYKAVTYTHGKIKEFASEAQREHPELFNNIKIKTLLDCFHSTLIFALFKRFKYGDTYSYVILTFGVGDCPIAVMNKDKTETTLLNWLDVGEFGGGTRFITQPEIFHSTSNPMQTRFNLKIIPDFSYLFLMTDGIYDPKFEVEANLEKNEKWIEFSNDLQGDNEEKTQVILDSNNEEIVDQLSRWMDFWSPGNHDDRTLAIIF